MNPYILWIVLLVGILWFTFVRPQRNARRRAAALSNALEIGDEVVTIGGLYGQIVSMDDREVELDVADGVTLRFTRRAIAGRAPELADHDDDEDETDDEDEADDGDLVVDSELVDEDDPADSIEHDASSEAQPVRTIAPIADDAAER